MTVKQPLYFWVAVLLTLPLAYFLIDRAHFVWTSQTVMSTVEKVTASNGRCGRKRRRNCTKFSALLKYNVGGEIYRFSVSAGTARGHDQPLSRARHHANQPVQVAYDPRNPRHAYRDAVWDIWGAPILTFILQLCAFFGSLTERRGESKKDRTSLDRSYLAARSGRYSRQR